MSQVLSLLNTLTDEELESLSDEQIIQMINNQDEQ
jgi:hypothetical protein